MKKDDYIRQLKVGQKQYDMFNILQLEAAGVADIQRLPFSIRILVENLLRKMDGRIVKAEDLENIARWQKTYDDPVEIPYHPARVLMQDFTGVPAVVDLAAMRDAMQAMGGNPEKVNPLVPVDLIVDHSVQVDCYGTETAVVRNVEKEYERNGERYALLKWAQRSFNNFKVVPPRSGICHQVNLEYLGRVVIADEMNGRTVAYPDTLVGLDSHTTMIDAIGVMGWGVGGIEAEAVMLGQPYYMSIPQVIGVKFTGRLQPGVTATDLVLTVTEMLRNYGVVEKFVEFFGPGLKTLTVPDRATISNMSPEYGATMGFFPVDEKTIDYLRMTSREEQAALVAAYTKENGLFFTGSEQPEYTDVLELDLASVQPCVSGPARPQDRIVLTDLKKKFADILVCEYSRDEELKRISQFHEDSGTQTRRAAKCKPLTEYSCDIEFNGMPIRIGNGSVVIAAITSCTNTSNPFVLLGAGLLARNAVRRGLKVPPFVKTSLAPGSKVVIQYLEDAGLMPYLEALGFHLAGFGCTTCIGNSGPLHPAIEKAVVDNDLNVAAVLSGNRNFEARIHQRVKSNFLASPMLVVAFALAGHIDVDLTYEPLGLDPNGEPVYLDDIWPKNEEIAELIAAHVKQEFFELEYGRIFDGDEFWRGLPDVASITYAWDEMSTYIKNPPYFEKFSLAPDAIRNIEKARVLAVVGDTITTDHISPAGAIPKDYPAGQYLISKGVDPADFNSYGSRRGNHEVMMRGTFGNIRLKNRLVPGKEGSYTLKLPEKEERYIYDAAMAYKDANEPLVVLAGKEYGAGSSRDWAAKGSNLLGVKAVIAQSFERIHRSNLVGMGVLPLVFQGDDSVESLGLDGTETYSISGIEDITPRKELKVKAVKADGGEVDFTVGTRLDSEIEVDYFRHGGILPYVLRKMVQQ
ncbi:MAG: aconitate hydratase AcnA [Desulfobacterales bacterium]|nr:MAG: aconitate hydratase AcnA [Desulfobacterales bacterium]